MQLGKRNVNGDDSTRYLVRVLRLARRSFLWEFAIVVVAYLLYSLVRGLVSGRNTEAFERSIGVMGFERDLGIFWELRM